MNKEINKLHLGEETEHLLKLLDDDKSLDGEGLARLLASQKIDKLKLISENAIGVICFHHPEDGRYLYASPATEKVMGYTTKDLEGKVPFDFIHPDHFTMLQQNIIATKAGLSNAPEKVELKFRTKNEGYQWFEGYTKPIYNKKQEVVLLLSCTVNIQDRKIAEIAKHEREIIQQNLLLSSALLEKKKAIVKKIENKILDLDPDMRKELRGVLTYIQETLNLDEDWEDFMVHFKKVHPNFYKDISDKYPDLSKKDMKHLALIKLGMSSSDISKTMVMKKESLRVVRNRLKKKLKLDQNQNLAEFVQTL